MRPGTGITNRHLGDIAALVELLLGDSAGRVRAGWWSSCQVMAVTIPVRRDCEARAPRDRRHRLKVRTVELPDRVLELACSRDRALRSARKERRSGCRVLTDVR